MRQQRSNHTRGFARASNLVQSRVRSASEGRGFAQTRLLTHWAEVVGDEIAKIATPVDVRFGKGGMGATLTLLTTGAQAPMLDMQREQIKERVNACYGYKAINHVRITQTAPTGFADGRAVFEPAPKAEKPIAPEAKAAARQAAGDVESDALRAALEDLGAKIISRSQK